MYGHLKNAMPIKLLTIITAFLGSLPLTIYGQKIPLQPETNLKIAYLSPEGGAFDETIPEFRKIFNRKYPEYPLYEYKVIASRDISLPYIRAASRINDKLYSSAVLERGSEKIKSLQITLIPSEDAKISAENRKLAEHYMIGIINQFEPTISLDRVAKLTLAIDRLMSKPNQTQSDEAILGSIRYLMVKSHDNILTFAIEPIKLSLQ